MFRDELRIEFHGDGWMLLMMFIMVYDDDGMMLWIDDVQSARLSFEKARLYYVREEKIERENIYQRRRKGAKLHIR